jgi:hypothetical protein
MVEPVFSSTPTRAQVWLVECKLSPLHPGEDVYAHMCSKVDVNLYDLTTSMCREDERSLTQTLSVHVCYNGVDPHG